MSEKDYDPEDYDIEQTQPAENIVYELGLDYDRKKYRIEYLNLGKEKKSKAKQKNSLIKICRLFSYFRVIEISSGEEVNSFSPPIGFHIKYSEDAWYQAIENDETGSYPDHPRVAYLVSKGDDEEDPWVGDWVELTDRISQVVQPGTGGDPNGYLVFTIHKLNDPLIGGC